MLCQHVDSTPNIQNPLGKKIYMLNTMVFFNGVESVELSSLAGWQPGRLPACRMSTEFSLTDWQAAWQVGWQANFLSGRLPKLQSNSEYLGIIFKIFRCAAEKRSKKRRFCCILASVHDPPEVQTLHLPATNEPACQASWLPPSTRHLPAEKKLCPGQQN